jgi:hypothetical protein
VEADAQALPFADGKFDVVTSSFGAMFTPDQYVPPPPPNALSPLLWGTEEHVRQLFGDRVESLQMSERMFTE